MTNFRDLLKQAKSEVGPPPPRRSPAPRSGRTSRAPRRPRGRRGPARHRPGAQHLSRAHFESRVEDVLPDKDAEVVVYCATGVRSVFAARTLQELGYSNVSR